METGGTGEPGPLALCSFFGRHRRRCNRLWKYLFKPETRKPEPRMRELATGNRRAHDRQMECNATHVQTHDRQKTEDTEDTEDRRPCTRRPPTRDTPTVNGKSKTVNPFFFFSSFLPCF